MLDAEVKPLVLHDSSACCTIAFRLNVFLRQDTDSTPCRYLGVSCWLQRQTEVWLWALQFPLDRGLTGTNGSAFSTCQLRNDYLPACVEAWHRVQALELPQWTPKQGFQACQMHLLCVLCALWLQFTDIQSYCVSRTETKFASIIHVTLAHFSATPLFVGGSTTAQCF